MLKRLIEELSNSHKPNKNINLEFLFNLSMVKTKDIEIKINSDSIISNNIFKILPNNKKDFFKSTFLNIFKSNLLFYINSFF